MSKTEGNEKPVKQENKVNSEYNSQRVNTVVFTTTNNAFHFLTGTAWPWRKAEQIAYQESFQNNNKSTATVLNKDMQPTHLCVCRLFSIYQTYGKFIFAQHMHSRLVGSSCNFPLF